MTLQEYRKFKHYKELMENDHVLVKTDEYPHILSEDQECELLSDYSDKQDE